MTPSFLATLLMLLWNRNRNDKRKARQCGGSVLQVRTGSKLVATTVDGRNLFTQFIMVQEFFRQQYHGKFQIHFKGNCSPICKLWAVDKGNEAVRRVFFCHRTSIYLKNLGNYNPVLGEVPH